MSKAEENKKLVIEFFEQVFNQQNFSNLEKYLAPNVIEHNPDMKDGIDAFKTIVPPFMDQTPIGSWKLVHSIADDSTVWLHSQLPIGGKLYAIADIYKVENGKIVEHWDVLQEMLPSDVNPHPYF